MSVELMVKALKEQELRAFAEAQQKTIQELQRKNRLLEEKVTQLEGLLTHSTPLIEPSGIIHNIKVNSNHDFVIPGLDISPIQLTAEMELMKLYEISKDRALTLEEVKKYDVLTKTLFTIKEKNKENGNKAKAVDDADLLKMVTNGE